MSDPKNRAPKNQVKIICILIDLIGLQFRGRVLFVYRTYLLANITSVDWHFQSLLTVIEVNSVIVMIYFLLSMH